jgi:hypothetical protein
MADARSDGFYGRLKLMEVTLRFEANHTAALHTAIAAKENPSFKLIEIGMDKSMPP